MQSEVTFHKFYEISEIDDSRLTGAIIATRYSGKWVFCRQKECDTWELPGGKREPGEDILETAERELFEESGITKSTITPICVYKIAIKSEVKYGMLCYAEAQSLGTLPASEIQEVKLQSDIPANLTHPYTRTHLIPKALEFLGQGFKPPHTP